MTFTLFNSFPPEIQSMIIDQCPPNDATCLRLTCKYLYNFTTTKPKQRIDLETEDTGPLCCQELGHDWVSRHRHREQCHSISYEKHKACNDASGHKTPPMKRCRTSRYGMAHCECFTRRSRLHFRLAGWIGGGLKYCGTCGKFTKRKKQHNGRCYHGHHKPRGSEPKFWTHRSRKGAFGRKLWKKWFNNAAMNRFENRLNEPNSVRKGSERYEMRRLGPKSVNTRESRQA